MKDRIARYSSPCSFESTNGREKMYKIVTKEDTIRIPAEYMRKGQSLDQHIDRLSMTAFEGRFDDDNRFVLVTTNHQPLVVAGLFTEMEPYIKEFDSMQFYSVWKIMK